MWRIGTESALVGLVAKLLLGQSRHVEKILSNVPGIPLTIRDETRSFWVERLRSPEAGSPASYHRDGYLFQMISWIAAYKTYTRQASIKAPQARLADKGVDGLVLAPLGTGAGSGGAAGFRIVVCEDKASEHPRDTVRDEVWPSIGDFEAHLRDHELMPDVIGLIERTGSNDPEAIADAIFRERKFYRVSLALDAPPQTILFDGYDIAVPDSQIAQRRADYFEVPRSLRQWMQGFSNFVADALERIHSA
jgi:hypothetical protein